MVGRRKGKQLDWHCWKYYFVKFGADYTVQNRLRLENSEYVFAKVKQ
jgi:hypothetical protein